MINDSKLILTNEQLTQCACETAYWIKNNIHLQEPDKQIILLGVLTGAIVMISDIMKEIGFMYELTHNNTEYPKGHPLINWPAVKVDFVRVLTRPTATLEKPVKFIRYDPPMNSVKGCNVIIIDDIFDSGLTIDFIRKECEAAGANKVFAITALKRKSTNASDIKEPDFYWKEIDEKIYAFGYGMDMNGLYRELPEIYGKYI